MKESISAINWQQFRGRHWKLIKDAMLSTNGNIAPKVQANKLNSKELLFSRASPTMMYIKGTSSSVSVQKNWRC